jgi:hypothetical protein
MATAAGSSKAYKGKHRASATVAKTATTAIVPESEGIEELAKHSPTPNPFNNYRHAFGSKRRSGGSPAKPTGPSPIGKATDRSPILVAELIISFGFLGMEAFDNIAKNGYQAAISNVMLRASAMMACFFVLFLMSSSKRGSQVASLIGALITIGIAFDAVAKGSLTALTSVAQGLGNPNVTSTSIDLDSSLAPKEYYAES